jgi:hypothetical protein
MILQPMDLIEGVGQVWHCLGCGRELLVDAQAQAADYQLLHSIQTSAVAAPRSVRGRRRAWLDRPA